MDQPISDGDHKSLGGTTVTLIACILVIIYATTAMLTSENPDTWNTHESIENIN